MEYQYVAPVEEKKSNGVCIASLVCGIVSFCCCNPLYLVSIAAIITGIIGMCGKYDGKGMAIGGLILGAVSILVCVIVDILMLPITFGGSFFI